MSVRDWTLILTGDEPVRVEGKETVLFLRSPTWGCRRYNANLVICQNELGFSGSYLRPGVGRVVRLERFWPTFEEAEAELIAALKPH